MTAGLVVAISTHVEVELLLESGDRERLEFDLVLDERADFAHGFLGVGTPMARAIIGLPAGSAAPYTEADIKSITVLSVSPANFSPPDDAKAQREEAMRKVISEVERTSARNFASSFSGKWGDYDPDGIEKWEE
jgi:hypothetical protein